MPPCGTLPWPMKAEILSPPCPACGSRNIIYSCEPKCCFNHVCGDCQTSFQLVTRLAGGELRAEPPEKEPEGTDPTAECARCHELTVYSAGGQVVCTSCFARLELAMEEIAPPGE